MGTCRTCKHWRWIRDEDFAIGSDPANDLYRVWPGAHGECYRIEDDWINSPLSMAWIMGHIERDPEREYDISLITQPEFGCVCWEERDNTPHYFDPALDAMMPGRP